MKIVGQDQLLNDVDRVVSIFVNSGCIIRPHFILTGESGSGKSITIKALARKHKITFLEINAAQLTKEGTSGNSLSKALSPLRVNSGKPTIVFVDEFDKLFISGNSNNELAHETTNGVQNEFLAVLESNTTSVFGDYGKYIDVPTNQVLFVFAGAFNGAEEINLDKLRSFGLKTEFLGRVGLVFNTNRLTKENLFDILNESPLLESYIELFENTNRDDIILKLKKYIDNNYKRNTLGARMINTLIHQYFIKGDVPSEEDVKKVTFQNKMELNHG